MTDDPFDGTFRQAEDALDAGDVERAIDLCHQVLRASPDNPDAFYLLGECYRELGELDDAEQAYLAVVRADANHGHAFCGLAAVRFDQLRFDEARAAVLRALRADDGLAEAYYLRAMLRERRRDARGARRDYRRAFSLEPQLFPMPVELDDATVEAVVRDVLLTLHPTLRSYLSQVVILLEEVPEAELCAQFDPPAPPGEILGYFSGASLADRSTSDPWSGMPASIVLFRRNLERLANDREHLLDELRITLFHEVGHFLGLDEDDLEARGLD